MDKALRMPVYLQGPRILAGRHRRLQIKQTYNHLNETIASDIVTQRAFSVHLIWPKDYLQNADYIKNGCMLKQGHWWPKGNYHRQIFDFWMFSIHPCSIKRDGILWPISVVETVNVFVFFLFFFARRLHICLMYNNKPFISVHCRCVCFIIRVVCGKFNTTAYTWTLEHSDPISHFFLSGFF